MRTIEAVIRNGQVKTVEPLQAPDNARCVVTVLEETIADLQKEADAMLSPLEQDRLSELLDRNRAGQLAPSEERELDQTLARVHEQGLRKSQASRLLAALAAAD